MKTSVKNKSGKVAGRKIPLPGCGDKLIASEVRYRRLFESAQDGILILDAQTGEIIDVNPFLVKLLGFSKEELIKKEIWEIGLFKDIAANKIKFLLLQQEEYVRYENLPLETIDGRKINVEFVSNVYLENQRKIIQCNIRDITDRKRKEEALVNSENLRHTLLQTIPDLIWLKDIIGNYMSCNTSFERFFGASEADIIGKNDYDFIDSKLADNFLDNDRKAMNAGKPTMNEEWITFANDGHRAYLETIKSPMYDIHNALIGVLGIGRDITSRKKAEDLLLESEIKYRSFFENNMDAILLTSSKGETISVNQAACDMFGYSSDELIEVGKTGIEDISDPRLSYLLAERALKGKAKGEATFIRKDGTNFPAEISTSLFKNNEGLNSASMIIHDISERKNTERELIESKENAEESDRLKSAFLANMSHEIRTPMNGILGFTELLKEPQLTGEEQKEYIDIIEKSGARLLNIINDIISISKIESGETEISYSQININELIENLIAFFSSEAGQKNIKILFLRYFPVYKAIINTDKEKVTSILTNLIKNAIKFTTTGIIEVGYVRKNNYLEFFVKDTGLGVPEELKEIIFERFRQGSESLIRNYEGAGLGLSISKGYVDILGGKIWVESNPKRPFTGKLNSEKGSTFYFTIPYNHSEPENNPAKNSFKVIQKINLKKDLKIMIVEDDIFSELLISIIARNISDNILRVSTGPSAVETCRNNPDIDLILMDIKIPGMDGYEATRKIREFNKSVIIIAQTAYGLEGDREKAIEAGCNDYIPKPINQIKLKEMIEKHLDIQGTILIKNHI
jgi:PAS domain S-box-containing protein